MSNSVTLSTVKTRARQRADMEDSTFIGDSELNSYVNASYSELYDLLTATYEDYFTTSTTFTLVTGDSGVEALPTDFYKLRGLDYQLGGEWITVYPYDWNSRNLKQRSVSKIWLGDYDLAYRIMGTNLRIEPRDNATGDYQLWYIPIYTPLTSDTDTLNTSISNNGWEEYIVLDVAIKMLNKEESQTSHLVKEKDALIKRINSMAGDRDVDQPERISDVRQWRNDY